MIPRDMLLQGTRVKAKEILQNTDKKSGDSPIIPPHLPLKMIHH